MTLQTGKNGFTFTELLVVISIILVISASILTVIPRLNKDTQVKVTKTMIDRLEMAIEDYYGDNRFYPSGDIENLRSLLQSSDTTFKQYIEFNDEETSGNTIIDVWGNSLIYISPGNHNTSSYDLYSTGPDGTSTTTGSDIDDINNWSR